jgi:hypothetical protein
MERRSSTTASGVQMRFEGEEVSNGMSLMTATSACFARRRLS